MSSGRPPYAVTVPGRGARWRAVLVGTICALVFVELVVRQIYYLPQVIDPDFGLVPRPGQTVHWGREGFATSRWTDRGIRGTTPVGAAQHPVLALGDSFTEAFMVGDGETFSDVLGQGLKTAGIVVANAGRSSLSLADYVALAARYRALFAPQWTVIELRDEDLTVGAWLPSVTHFANHEGQLSVVTIAPHVSRLRRALLPLLQRSMLVSYALTRVGSILNPAGPEVTGDPGTMSAPVGEELMMAHAAYDGRVTFLYLPSSFDLDHPLEGASGVEQEVARVCAVRQLSCVNLRQSFPAMAAQRRSPFGFSNTAFNEGHMNRTGHRYAGELLVAEVEPRVSHSTQAP